MNISCLILMYLLIMYCMYLDHKNITVTEKLESIISGKSCYWCEKNVANETYKAICHKCCCSSWKEIAEAVIGKTNTLERQKSGNA
jgi:hypothetical protein